MNIYLIGEWNSLVDEGNKIIKERKPVFGEAEWLKYIKKFKDIIREKPTKTQIDILKRIISGLKR